MNRINFQPLRLHNREYSSAVMDIQRNFDALCSAIKKLEIVVNSGTNLYSPINHGVNIGSIPYADTNFSWADSVVPADGTIQGSNGLLRWYSTDGGFTITLQYRDEASDDYPWQNSSTVIGRG